VAISDIQIVATLDRRDGPEPRRVSHLELTRSIFQPNMIVELDDLWRVLRARAHLHRWIATLTLHNPARARTVSMRDPPFEAHELRPTDRASHILEALRKVMID
jgi:hypothetical protein